MSFKFHYFNDKIKYQRPFSARKLISNMKSQYNANYFNNNNELNINTVRSLQLSHDINSNAKIKRKILSKNLENELNSKNLNEILLLMLTYNNYLPDDLKIENEKRNDNDIECSNIISCFQLLIKFLYEKKSENENYNNILEKRISALKQESNLDKYNDIIQKNNQKLNQLQEKKKQLRTFLNNNGKKLPSETTKKLYICNICPEEKNKFDSYRAFHQHYVRHHVNPYLFYNSNNNTNMDMGFMTELDKKYFETKMDNMLEQFKTTLKSKIYKKGIEKNFGTGDYGLESGMLKSGRQTKRNEINRKNYDLIKERIERLENNQKKFEILFKNNVDNFLKELKNEIEKLK